MFYVTLNLWRERLWTLLPLHLTRCLPFELKIWPWNNRIPVILFETFQKFTLLSLRFFSMFFFVSFKSLSTEMLSSTFKKLQLNSCVYCLKNPMCTQSVNKLFDFKYTKVTVFQLVKETDEYISLFNDFLLVEMNAMWIRTVPSYIRRCRRESQRLTQTQSD